MNPPPRPPPTPPRHNSTGFSSISKRLSFKKAAETPPPAPSPNHTQDQIPEYNLAIHDLRSWLRTRFPGHTFEGNSIEVRGDKYVVWVPEKLSDCEKMEIADLRKAEAQAPEVDY